MVRIHLPPAESPVRTWFSQFWLESGTDVPKRRRPKRPSSTTRTGPSGQARPRQERGLSARRPDHRRAARGRRRL